MSARKDRIKLFINRNFSILLVVCLILVLFGGYLTYATYVDPGTETEQVEESSWSSSVDISHGATVSEETPVFRAGEQVTQRPSYFTAIMPESNGTVQYRYQATEGGELDVSMTLTAVIRSAQDAEDGTIELWRQERPLTTDSQEGVTPGDTVEVPFGLNVTELTLLADRINEQLGGSPGQTEVLVVTELAVSGVRNGKEVQESYQYETVLDIGGTVYTYEQVGPFEESGQQIVEREFEATHGPVRSALAPLLLLIGIAGAGFVTAGRFLSEFELSQTEREWLDYRTTYDEYEEWISTGRVSKELHPRSTVTIDTLDQLVDVGIDSDRRVIHDQDRSQCLVLVDDVAYIYSIPNRPPDVEQEEVTAVAGTETPEQENPESSDDEENTRSKPDANAEG